MTRQGPSFTALRWTWACLAFMLAEQAVQMTLGRVPLGHIFSIIASVLFIFAVRKTGQAFGEGR